MTHTASEILRIQRQQFDMAISWMNLIESPKTGAEAKTVAIEQYATIVKSIAELAFEVGGVNLKSEILETV